MQIPEVPLVGHSEKCHCTEDTTGFTVWKKPLSPPLFIRAERDGKKSLVSQEFCIRDSEPCPEGFRLHSSGRSSRVSPWMAPCSASIAVCHDP